MVRIVALSDDTKQNIHFNPPAGYKLRNLSRDYTIGIDIDNKGDVDNNNVYDNRLLWFKWKIKNRGSWAYIACNIWFPLYVEDKDNHIDQDTNDGKNKNDDKSSVDHDKENNVDQKPFEIDEHNDVEDLFRTKINRIERRRDKHINSQSSGRSNHPSKIYSRKCRKLSFKRTMTRNEVSRRRDTKYKIANLCIDCFYEKTVVDNCPECKKLRDEENYYINGLCDWYDCYDCCDSSDDWYDWYNSSDDW